MSPYPNLSPAAAIFPITLPFTPDSAPPTLSDVRKPPRDSTHAFHAFQWKQQTAEFAFPASPTLHICSQLDQSVPHSLTSPTCTHCLASGPEPQHPSRLLFVSGVPRDASLQALDQAFLTCGDLKSIFVRFQADHGVVILVFYDIRHIQRAHRQINDGSLSFNGAPLRASIIYADDLHSILGQCTFVSTIDSSLRVATTPAGPRSTLDPFTLQNILSYYGDLRTFAVVDAHAKAFFAEFFDARDATRALDALDGRVVFNKRIHLMAGACTIPPVHKLQPPAVAASTPNSPTPAPQQNSIPFPSSSPRLSVDSTLPADAPAPAHAPSRSVSNRFHFDYADRGPAVLRMPPRPRSASVASEPVGLGLVGQPEDDETPLLLPSHSPPPQSVSVSMRPATIETGSTHADEVIYDSNEIDIAKIERGDDTRTTVMIRNIPNKMRATQLIDFINDVVPRSIDFMYLRMDFVNECNVGYAFVNFVRVEDLLHFAKSKLGARWNIFSSNKVLGMSYAKFQGKEALINKFRFSPIMYQREAWRPRFFYSAGPQRGLPEEFPVAAPTHASASRK